MIWHLCADTPAAGDEMAHGGGLEGRTIIHPVQPHHFAPDFLLVGVGTQVRCLMQTFSIRLELPLLNDRSLR